MYINHVALGTSSLSDFLRSLSSTDFRVNTLESVSL